MSRLLKSSSPADNHEDVEKVGHNANLIGLFQNVESAQMRARNLAGGQQPGYARVDNSVRAASKTLGDRETGNRQQLRLSAYGVAVATHVPRSYGTALIEENRNTFACP